MDIQSLMMEKRMLEQLEHPSLHMFVTEISSMIVFLKKEINLPYPDGWFWKNTSRTKAMYHKHYRIHQNKYIEELSYWNKCQTRLNYLNTLLKTTYKEIGIEYIEFEKKEQEVNMLW